MSTRKGAGLREMTLVLTVALLGLALASLAAFNPWYGTSAESARNAVVDVRIPHFGPLDGGARASAE